MKTQISNQHTNVTAVQQPTTLHKEDRMKKQSSTTLKLAVIVAMALTLALSAVAQDEIIGGAGSTYQNPMQLALKEWYQANLSAIVTGLYPGGGSFSSPGTVVFDGSNIWVEHVVSGGPNKVDKLQASDGKFIASYTVGKAGTDADPSAYDGTNIWAPDHSPSSTTVYAVRAADGTTTACNLGSSATYPNTVAFDGKYVWVSTDNGYVVQFGYTNTSAGVTCGPVKCTTHNLGSRLYGLAYDGNGTMWVTAVDSNQVIGLNSSCAQTTAYTVEGPIGIVFDGTNLWTANQTGNSISRITLPGGKIATFSLGFSPWWIAYDGANVWTTGYTTGKVGKNSTSTGAAAPGSPYSVCGSASSDPLTIAFDGAHMWVGCQGNNELGKM